MAQEKANVLKLEMSELQQRAEAFALQEKHARQVQLAVLRECEQQAERDRQQYDTLRLQDQAHAQERHECLLSQQRLVIEHQAAQAYGEAAAAEIRVAELVAEESLQQGATLFWKSRDEHLTKQREMAANAEMALQNLKRAAEEHVRERELQLQQWAQQLSAQHAADLLAERQSAHEAADREVQQRLSLQDQADRDKQRRLAQEAMVAAAAQEMEKVRLKDLEAKRRERLKIDEARQRQER